MRITLAMRDVGREVPIVGELRWLADAKGVAVDDLLAAVISKAVHS